MSKKLLISLIVAGLAVFGFWHFVSAFTTNSSGYANNGAPSLEVYRGWTNVLIMDVSLPDPGTDTALAGSGTPSAGTAINTTNPWTATGGVRFYDDGDGVWEATSDGIYTDDDKDEVYTRYADDLVDGDGSTSLGSGTVNDGEQAGDPLIGLETLYDGDGDGALYFWDGDNNGVWSTGEPIVYDPNDDDGTTVYDADATSDDDNDGVAGDDILIYDPNGVGVTEGATLTAFDAADNLAFYDADTDSVYALGEDIFVDYHDGGTYSAAEDTILAGGILFDGTALTSTNPWASATVPVFFYDGGTSGVWESASDGIFTDNDQSGYYNGDKISSVTVSNAGNALDSDISAIKVWQEDGTTSGFQSSEDTLIGSISSATKWGQAISATAPVYTASSKNRIYVTADIATTANKGKEIQAQIPVNGLQFTSTNDGPTDAAITNPYIQTIVVSAKLDTVAPTSSITHPEDGATIIAGKDYTIFGTCSDEGGSSVKEVKISLDGGKTWSSTTPLEANISHGYTWLYLWKNPQPGTYSIKTRATDWSGNTETPGEGITVEVRELTCSDYTTENECLSSGCYWYENACHSEEQVVEKQPKKEKPIEEMTAEELKAKILEVQQQIINLLQQLIEMIKEQILELGGSV